MATIKADNAADALNVVEDAILDDMMAREPWLSDEDRAALDAFEDVLTTAVEDGIDVVVNDGMVEILNRRFPEFGFFWVVPSAS